MRNSLILPLAIAIGCGTVAAVGVTHAMRGNGSAAAPSTTEIYVAIKDMDVGDEVTDTMVRLEQWPADRIPLDAVNDFKQISGKFVNQRLFAGEPLLLKKLNASNDSAAAKIPSGYRAVTLDLNGDPGLAYLVRPGHRADVMGFFEKSDVIPETTIKTVLSDVRVFAVDGETIRREEQEGARKPAKTVSMLIREEDQEAWTWAEQLGKIKLSLRNDRSTSASEADTRGPNQAGQDFVTWIRKLEDERIESKAQASFKPPVASPMPQAAPVPATPKEDWRMEVWTPEGPLVYQWKDGNSVPELMNGEKQDGKSMPDLSYLNGSQSPFFAAPPPPPAPTGPAVGEEDKADGDKSSDK